MNKETLIEIIDSIQNDDAIDYLLQFTIDFCLIHSVGEMPVRSTEANRVVPA